MGELSKLRGNVSRQTFLRAGICISFFFLREETYKDWPKDYMFVA